MSPKEETKETVRADTTAWVKLYHPCGALVTLPLPLGAEELRAIYDSVSAALDVGFMVEQLGADPNERVEQISGWVLGETSEGEPCVHLYGDPRLKYRLVTVWIEDMGKLPMFLGKSRDEILKMAKGMKAYPASAPEREIAERKGYFQHADFKVVLRNVAEEGQKPHWRFDRVVGIEQPHEQPTEAKGNVTIVKRPYPPEVLVKKIRAIAESLGDMDISEAKAEILANALSVLWDAEDIPFVLGFVASAKDVDALSGGYAEAFLRWLGNGNSAAVDMKWTPDDVVKKEAEALLDAALSAA